MVKKQIAQSLGKVIRELRLERGFSQEEFAMKCGLHRTYIGSIERGEKNVTVETAYKIAKTLNVSLSELFTRLEQLDFD
jgi:transcriptional regulator with XRE-family HTH domain